jgi:sugar phosphate isomerase/epimerase
MRPLNPFEIGLMFWATGNAQRDIESVRAFDLQAGQLGFPGDLPLDGFESDWSTALQRNDEFTLTTAVCSYVGEDYSDVANVQSTVGFVPLHSRSERIARTKDVARVAASLGITSVAAHIGFVPENRCALAYRDLREAMQDLCDTLSASGQSFALETGQETADALLAFIDDVERPNLKINFDPANMILYGTGDPIEAVGTLRRHMISVHCKDGVKPTAPGLLGTERPLGSGEVNIPAFLGALREADYKGILSIEREEPDFEQRTRDIHVAVRLLRSLRNE